MTLHRHISASISRAAISTLLALGALSASAQGLKPQSERPDTTRFFRGLQVMADVVGPIQLAVSDYGQYEAALRINFKDKYFPVFELGYGTANHEDDPVTHVAYKTSAPYGKVGMDFNIMKNKHDIYRVYIGARYAFTTFKYDVASPVLTDPVWKDPAAIQLNNVSASYHWAELLFAVDAKIWGPLHLGWSVRYRRRLAHNDGESGNVWYVPGFGKTGNSRLGGTFNIIINL